MRFYFGRDYSLDESTTIISILIFSLTPWILCLWQRIKSIRLYDFVTVESFPHSRNKSQATQKPIMHSWYVNHSRIKFNNSNETKSTWQISNNPLEQFFFYHPAVKTNWNGRIMMCKVLQNNAMDFAAAAARNNLYQKNICWVPFAITGSWDQCTVNYSPPSISPLLYSSDAAYQFALLYTGR